MNVSTDIELLKLMWHSNLPCSMSLTTTDHRTVSISDYGDYDHESGCFVGAKVVIDDLKYHGVILFSAGSSCHALIDHDAILQVTPYPSTLVCMDNGTILPQLIVEIPESVQELYRQLRAGASAATCAKYINEYICIRRASLFQGLQIDRICRKRNDVMTLYAQCEQDWNQTMYTMLLRTMGDNKNKDAFGELAKRVPYHVISRERNAVAIVESLLLCTSGLLDQYDKDAYTYKLADDYKYLSSKYNIAPMSLDQWSLQRVQPHNHPILRLVQLAAFLCCKDFVFDSVINCGTWHDIDTLFDAEASTYWQTHYIPAQTSVQVPKRLGKSKKELLGINFVSPLQAAYGQYSCNDAMSENAINILDLIGCESNQITTKWSNAGICLKTAFDSQAILQLHNEYCLKGLCSECLVGKNLIKERLKDCK